MATVARTQFGEWLAKEMYTRRLNKSQVAAFAGVDPSAVGRWLKDEGGSAPSPASCRSLAGRFHVQPEFVLRLAGYLPPSVEDQPVEALPSWVKLIPMLAERDRAYVGRLVESLFDRPIGGEEPPSREGS